MITQPGDINYFREGMQIKRYQFDTEVETAQQSGLAIPQGYRVNPVYLPAPHAVLRAMYTSFTTEPKRRSEQWLHESLWHSVTIIFLGFTISSIFGLPLGILCGAYMNMSKLFEPFIEFFRYFPAPAFGALAVAILGIHDAPKIAIIFIGTFFQQVLIVANTTRLINPALIEAARTLGASHTTVLTRVIVPGVLPNLFRDCRILLGWAWTYLIVAELIGKSSGITWFITQQARYKNFDNVFAAIMMIGLIGLVTDLILSYFGKRLFRWHQGAAT
ncbi:MAG: NitT/TauT family transport system permease protein [Candidatus Azotimanducaceae bacterium]|jgi:NitT/TauT family transport system permease protein